MAEYKIPPVIMEEVTDPEELAKAKAQDERFARNWAWFQTHASDVYLHRGKCICIAGEELFIADTPEEAVALATAVHPEDNGYFLHYIPKERVARIYANNGEWYIGDDGTARPIPAAKF